MNFFNFRQVYSYTSVPYNHYENIEVIGVKLGLQYQISPFIDIYFKPVFRYDYIHSYFVPSKDLEDVSEPIFDLHFGLNWRRGRHTAGVGYSVFNTGKSFVFSNGPAFQNIHWNLEFTGFHLLYNRTIWKHFTFEPKIIYLWRGIPSYREKSMMTYSLSMYYNVLGFGWKKVKKE